MTCLKASLIAAYCTCFRLCAVSFSKCMLMIVCASVIICCRKHERVGTVTCEMVMVCTVIVYTVTPFEERTEACCQAVLTVEKHCCETELIACFSKEIFSIVNICPGNSDLILCDELCAGLLLRICNCICRSPFSYCCRLSAKVGCKIIIVCFANIFKCYCIRDVDITILCFGNCVCFYIGIRVVNLNFVRIVSVSVVTNKSCTVVTACIANYEVGNFTCEFNAASVNR